MDKVYLLAVAGVYVFITILLGAGFVLLYLY